MHTESSYTPQDAQNLYDQYLPAPANHPYLNRKGIQPHSAKINDAGMLVIPFINEEGKVQSLAFIDHDGSQSPIPTSQTAASFSPIGFGRHTSPQQIIMTEEYATAATLYEATGIPAVHTQRGDTARVMAIMQKQHPDAQIILAVDNTPDRITHAGMEAARNAQRHDPGITIMQPPRTGNYNDLALMPNGRQRIQEQFANLELNQYITESRAEQLLSSGRYDLLLNAARSDNMDLTPALCQKLINTANPAFAREIMRIGLHDQTPQVREAAATKLAQANEGAPGPNFQSISRADVETIRHDASELSRFAAAQTDMDKAGIDLPDNIKAVITSWRQEIGRRQKELGLSDAQVEKLTDIMTSRIIKHQEKDINTPQEVYKQTHKEQPNKSPQKKMQYEHE
jgi:DNA primase traC